MTIIFLDGADSFDAAALAEKWGPQPFGGANLCPLCHKPRTIGPRAPTDCHHDIKDYGKGSGRGTP